MVKERVKWVDYAKGITIILVVLLHSNYAALHSESIHFFNTIFNEMRMPLFFYISGLFIHKAITSDWPLFAKNKVMPLLYLYVLWSIIRYFTDSLPRKIFLGEEAFLNNLFTIFIEPRGTYWFIYVLLIFLIITWIFSSIPKLAFGVSLIFFTISIQSGDFDLIDRIAQYYPMFLLGYLSSKFVMRWTNYIKIPYVLFPVLYFSILIMLQERQGFDNPLAIFIISLGGIISGIIIATLLAKRNTLPWLGYVGQNTLIIYVMHYIPTIISKLTLPIIMPNYPTLATLITLAAGITVPLLIAYIARRIGMNWLFHPTFMNRLSK